MMSAHKKFVHELRAPVQKYKRMARQEEIRRNSTPPQTHGGVSKEIVEELFEKLFASDQD